LGRFSPDGTRIVTTSSDNVARVWDIAPSQAKCPDWLPSLAEAISGRVLSNANVVETQLNRMEVINRIRRKLNEAANDDMWAVWGRWFLAEYPRRTISPFSGVTVPEYVELRIKEGTSESLDEAEGLAEADAELLEKIFEARKALKLEKPGGQAATPTEHVPEP
jgi:hypothetical protein